MILSIDVAAVLGEVEELQIVLFDVTNNPDRMNAEQRDEWTSRLKKARQDLTAAHAMLLRTDGGEEVARMAYRVTAALQLVTQQMGLIAFSTMLSKIEP